MVIRARKIVAAVLAGTSWLVAQHPGTGLAQEPSPRIAQAGPAAVPAPVKFSVLSSASAASHSEYFYARDGGLFAKHGLDVQFVTVDASPAALAALVAGTVQFAYVGPNIVDAVVAKLPVTVVFAISATPNFEVCASRAVRTIQDLAGKSIATINRGSSFDLGLRVWLQEKGFAEGQVTIRNINAGTAAMFAAMISGAADAATPSPTGERNCRDSGDQGFHVLDDVGASSLQLFGAGIAVNRNFLAANRDVVRRAVAAMYEAQRTIKDNRAVGLAYVAQFEKLTDPKVIESTWSIQTSRWVDPPMVPEAAMLNAVKVSPSESTRSNGPAAVSEMFDNSLVAEVIKSR